MKLQELLIVEDMSQLSPMIKLIKRDCQPFLKKVKGQPLYRGVKLTDESKSLKKMGPYMVKGTVRKDRKAKDSSSGLHRALDRTIKDNFHLPGRSGALFASFSSTTALSYGNEVFMIFPIGEVEFLWSPVVYDAYDVFEQSWGEFDFSKDLEGWIKDAIDKLQITYTNGKLKYIDDLDPQERLDVTELVLDEHIKDMYTMEIVERMAGNHNGHEIMIYCDSYYGIKLSALQDDDLFDVRPQDLMNRLGS